MTVRTTETTVTFRHPFTLSAFDHAQPAGTYRLLIDEEEVPDISFSAFRRSATLLETPAISTPGTTRELFPVSAEELASALEADIHDD